MVAPYAQETADKRTASSCKLHVNYVKAVFHAHKNQKIRARLFKLLSFPQIL